MLEFPCYPFWDIFLAGLPPKKTARVFLPCAPGPQTHICGASDVLSANAPACVWKGAGVLHVSTGPGSSYNASRDSVALGSKFPDQAASLARLSFLPHMVSPTAVASELGLIPNGARLRREVRHVCGVLHSDGLLLAGGFEKGTPV